MVDIHPPPSMSSTLVSNQYTAHRPLPPLTQPRDFAPRDLHSCYLKESGGRDHLTRWIQTSATIEHGLGTPPKEMNGNPLLAPNVGGLPYNSIPAIRQNNAQYTTSLSTVASTKYTSKAPPVQEPYKVVNQPASPTSKNNNVISREQPRRAAAESNTIVSYLQIPPSINDSKGSLSEFAAQITCLFWFESSYILHSVEESRTTPMPSTPLVPEAIPSMGFRKWVTTILSTTQVTQNVILLALMFIYRLKRLNPGVKGKLGSEFRLLTVALMLGNKFLDDNTYTNKTWAEVSGISVQEIHIMEVEFLSNMRYTLYASEAEWKDWHIKLGKFWTYFDMASKASADGVPKLISLPVPLSKNRHELPSPPASIQTSPPFATNQSGPSILSSPIARLPDFDMRPYGRKRSYDDPNQEPPAKRVSLTPSANSTSSAYSTSSASTLKDNVLSMPRLPMPNLTVSTGGHYGGNIGSSSLHLPMPPTRSMATAFPGPSRWPQNGMLPSLQSSTYFPTNNSMSPVPEWTNRRSPYPPGSATPSPTSHSFPPPQQTNGHVSPSGYPISRSSPYKPVRSVNTLLVPPPSSSMHNLPQNLAFDQMHYQPLGKPFSERRAGVLPYMHHDDWSQQYQIPPHPKFV